MDSHRCRTGPVLESRWMNGRSTAIARREYETARNVGSPGRRRRLAGIAGQCEGAHACVHGLVAGEGPELLEGEAGRQKRKEQGAARLDLSELNGEVGEVCR
jgi:hypothetical protein